MRWWASVTGAVVFASAAAAFGQSTGRFPDAPPTAPTSPTPPAPPTSSDTPPAPVAPAPVAPAPVAPAPVAPAPVAPAVVPPPYWQPPPAVSPPREPDPEVKHSGIVFIPRFGFRLTGGGEISRDCEGVCDLQNTESTDYDDRSSFGFGLDVLGAVIPELRLGASAFWIPDTELEIDGSSEDVELGSDLTLAAVVEGVIQAGPRVSIALRGFVGLWMLFPDGDLDDAIEEEQRDCDSAPAGFTCEVDDGPYLGPTFGLGPGLVFPLRGVSLRVDLYYQWYSVEILHKKVAFAGQSQETSNQLTGSRVMLVGGVEF